MSLILTQGVVSCNLFMMIARMVVTAILYLFDVLFGPKSHVGNICKVFVWLPCLAGLQRDQQKAPTPPPLTSLFIEAIFSLVAPLFIEAIFLSLPQMNWEPVKPVFLASLALIPRDTVTRSWRLEALLNRAACVGLTPFRFRLLPRATCDSL